MRSKRLRAAALLLACSILLALFVSCGNNDRKKFVMRTMSTLGAEKDFAVYSEILSEYTKTHKNVTINDTSTDLSNSYKMELSLTSTYKGTGTPDLIYCSAMSDMSELGDYFVTIDEIHKDNPKFASSVSETVINSAAASDGKRYCIPVRGEWRGIIVNAALFRQSGLNVPETWKDIVQAAYHFKDSNIYLFANSLEDSSAMLEYMVRSIGGSNSLNSAMNGKPDKSWSEALDTIAKLDELNSFPPMNSGAFDSLVSRSDLKNTVEEGKSAESSISLYNSGKAAIMLIDNSLCKLINTDLDSKYIMLPNVDTSVDAFETTTTSFTTTSAIPTSFGKATRTSFRNTLPPTQSSGKARNSGGNETSQNANTATAPSSALSNSDVKSDMVSLPENGLYVYYSEGFYITKKAYYDEDKRADILEFVEMFLDEQNCIKLCTESQVPSLSSISKETLSALTNKSNIYKDVVDSVQSADKFVITTQTNNNRFFWNHCEMAVTYMSKGVLSKQKAISMIADTQMSVADAFSS